MSQMYSDNLRLAASSSSQGGFITQLAPDIQITRNSSKSNVNVNARLQYLIYEGINISPKLYPQLQMTSNTELYDDSLFLTSSSRISQGNPSAIGSINSSNIYQSTTANSTTYSAFSIAPYWRPHLGGYANGELRLGYNYFTNTRSGASDTLTTTSNRVANLESHTFQESVHLVTGSRFEASRIAGRLSFNNQNQQYASTTTSSLRFRSYNGELSFQLTKTIGAFAQAGYYDNLYPNRVPTNNGAYLTPGLSWTPSPNFSLAAGYGLNAYFGNIVWHPSQRTSFHLNYRHSQVGGSNYGLGMYGGGGGVGGSAYGTTSGAIPGFDYNPIGSSYSQAGGYPGQLGGSSPTGALGANNIGSSWNGGLQHRTRTTTWNATYITSTTTIQQYLSGLLYGNTTPILSGNERDISSPNLTNNLMLMKRAQGSVTWQLSKSSFTLSAYQSNINYLTGGLSRPQDMYGLTASWDWKLSSRISTMVYAMWQSTEIQQTSILGNASPKTQYLSASLSVNRQFSSTVEGFLRFTHYQSNSTNLVGSNLFSGRTGSYNSNQISANLNINF